MYKIKNKEKLPSYPLHYLDKVVSMGCHLLICFCFLIVAVLLMSDAMFLVLYIIAFKCSIFNLQLDLELHA